MNIYYHDIVMRFYNRNLILSSQFLTVPYISFLRWVVKLSHVNFASNNEKKPINKQNLIPGTSQLSHPYFVFHGFPGHPISTLFGTFRGKKKKDYPVAQCSHTFILHFIFYYYLFKCMYLFNSMYLIFYSSNVF